MNRLTKSMLMLPLMMSASEVMSYPSGHSYWQHRSILYFVPTTDAQVKNFLQQSMQNHCQLRERDVIILVVTPTGFEQTEYQLSADYARELRSRYKISPEQYTGVLVGKDGTEKHRWGDVTNWQELMQIIDNMPMRQREMAEQASPCSV